MSLPNLSRGQLRLKLEFGDAKEASIKEAETQEKIKNELKKEITNGITK